MLSLPTRTDQQQGGAITARLLGFLRPPESWDNDEMLRVCASYSVAVLNMSRDAEYVKLVSILRSCAWFINFYHCLLSMTTQLLNFSDLNFYSGHEVMHMSIAHIKYNIKLVNSFSIKSTTDLKIMVF
jgi:hypothetical protein